MYNVNLECYKGPMDVLLYLIEKMEIDIYNVSIAKLTENYLEYIKNMGTISLENAEEYLVMASKLLYLKSKSLLPVENEENNKEEEKIFVSKLVEYQNYKKISLILQDMKNIRENFGEKESEDILIDGKLQNIDINLLMNSFIKIIKNYKQENHSNNIIKFKEMSKKDVRNKILIKIRDKKNIYLNHIFLNFVSKSELILGFLCILDMLSEQYITYNSKSNTIIIKAKDK